MEKFSTLTAVAAPIDIDNLDTDQLMPKQFLHGIDKSGLAQGLLWNFRMNADGTPKSGCVLNRRASKRQGSSSPAPTSAAARAASTPSGG